jgi:hypothetical protein
MSRSVDLKLRLPMYSLADSISERQKQGLGTWFCSGTSYLHLEHRDDGCENVICAVVSGYGCGVVSGNAESKNIERDREREHGVEPKFYLAITARRPTLICRNAILMVTGRR